MQMPFGKHKGVEIEDLPHHYIYWCFENIEKLSPRIRAEMEEAVGWTKKEEARTSTSSKASPPPSEAAAIIKKAYRQMALKYHPDKGGNIEQMIAVNEFYQVLTEELKFA